MNVPYDAGVFESQKDWWIPAFSIVEGATFAIFMEWALRIGRAESSARSARSEACCESVKRWRFCMGCWESCSPKLETGVS